MMFKTALNMIAGALICAAVSAAFAVTGTPPLTGIGPALIDGQWLGGVVGGQNFTFQAGITAHAGGTQAACLNLTPGTYLYEVDTVATTADSVCIPFAIAGTNFQIRNNTTTTMNVYAQTANNPVSAAADLINGTSNVTAYQLTSQQSAECFAAKAGVWSCVHGT